VESRFNALGERLTPGFPIKHSEMFFQSVVGHHDEPLELDFRRNVAAIPNSAAQIGRAAQLAAAELGEAICAVFDPSEFSPANAVIPTLSFALAGLATLSDWLGSNRHWFKFEAPRDSAQLMEELMRYWRDVAQPRAKRAVW